MMANAKRGSLGEEELAHPLPLPRPGDGRPVHPGSVFLHYYWGQECVQGNFEKPLLKIAHLLRGHVVDRRFQDEHCLRSSLVALSQDEPERVRPAVLGILCPEAIATLPKGHPGKRPDSSRKTRNQKRSRGSRALEILAVREDRRPLE